MKNIKYFIPLVIILLLPWTFRLSLENILLAVPQTTIEDAKAIAWILGGGTCFILLMIFIVNDNNKNGRY